MESRTELVVKGTFEKELTGSLLRLVFVSCLASVQYGYNLWLCYSETTLVKEFYNLTYYGGQKHTSQVDLLYEDLLLGFSVVLFPLGAMVGALLLGVLVDKFGRKDTLVINNYFSLMFSMLMVCANVQQAFLFAMFSRFLIGISMGIFSSVVPLYLVEISPVKLRGCIGMAPHLFLVFGVQLAQILAFPELLGTLEGWPVLVSFTGIVAIFQILLLPPFPESPRYLLIQKKEEEAARQALKDLRLRSNVEDEMEELRQEDIFEMAEKKMNSLWLLGYRELNWHIISVLVLVAGQQLSGVNVIYVYAEKLTPLTGLRQEDARYLPIMTNVLLIIAILLGMYVVDSRGRKVLLLIGFGVSTFLCILLTVTIELQLKYAWLTFLNCTFIHVFLVTHAVGPSALVNLLIGELFLQSTRSSAYVVGEFSHWFLNCLTVSVFRHVEKFVGPYGLLLCAPVNIFSFFYTLKMIPETKGKTFLEIRGLVPVCRAKQTPLQEEPGT